MRTILLFLTLILAVSMNATAADLPSAKTIQTELEQVKKAEQNEANKAIAKNYEDTLGLLDKLEKQKADTETLRKSIDSAAIQLKTSQNNLDGLKKREKTSEQLQAEFSKLSLAD